MWTDVRVWWHRMVANDWVLIVGFIVVVFAIALAASVWGGSRYNG